MPRTIVLTIAALCLIFGATAGFAQGVFFSAHAGYGLGSGTQSITQSVTSTVTGDTYEGIYGSLGEGLKFGGSAGYMFSNSIGVEFGFSYWSGKDFENKFTATGTNQTGALSGSGFVFTPSIILSASMGSVNPYARFGAVLGFMKVTQEFGVEQGTQVFEYTSEETGNLSFGYSGALGITVPAGDLVSFFAEAALYSVTYSPAEREITRYTVNGVDQRGNLTQTKYTFEDTYTTPSTNTMLSIRRPFSSIGFAVGARVNL